MNCKSILIVTLTIFVLISMASVCASDADDTAIASEDTSQIDLSQSTGIETDNLKASEDNQVIQQADDEILKATDNGTFQDLEKKISSASGTIYLENDYVWDDTYSTSGIDITNEITIDGQGHKIDGKGKSRIFNVEMSDVVIKNIIFVNGKAGWSGSAITVNGWDCNISDCTFINNTAMSGGAITMGDGTILSGCNFVNNSATQDGGAISSVYGGKIINCSFTNNKATNDGGALNIQQGVLFISNSNFIQNCATRNGGAINTGCQDSNISGCVFLSNNASSIIYYQSFYKGLKINNNIFLNHDKGSEIVFTGIDDTSDINYNWFGNDATNYKDQPTFENVNATVWLFLNSTVNPNSIAVLGSSDISFKLYTYGNNEISDFDNNLLGDIDLTITATNGNVDKNVVKLAENIKYTATVAGAGSVTASVGNSKYNANVSIIKATTKITASAVKTVYNNNKNLIVTLTDDKGTPISGAKITIKINGAKTYTTDKNGQVKVNVGKIVPKTYNAKITLAEDANYKASQATVKVTVKKATPKITAKKKTFKKAKKVKKYTITLKSGKIAVKKVQLTLKVNGKTIKAKTNAKGKATFKVKNLNSKGKFKAVIKFKGNKYYNKATKKVTITVK